MPEPRKALISLEATPYYHCVSRCVRRAFLIGDQYEHRRRWVEERIAELQRVFAIDVCAFAVMSNHTHLVLHVDSAEAKAWSMEEVIERWTALFKGPLLVQRYRDGERLDGAERGQVDQLAGKWRQQLTDISWFMRCLNEFIARKANKEERCSGRFWEGRFRSQALLDEKALLACMAYADLNPIRAKMAETPEESDHTSIQQRIRGILGKKSPAKETAVELMPFVGDLRDDMPKGIAFAESEYLELADWTGRAMAAGKRGVIPEHLPPILERLNIDARQWFFMTVQFENRFKGFVGAARILKEASRRLCYRRTPRLGECRALLST